MTDAPLFRRPLVVASFGRWAGLGNRVRVVLGARNLARAFDREFRYVWPTGRRFEPRFTDLWHVPERTVPQAVAKALAINSPWQDHTLRFLEDPAAAGRRVWRIRTSHALAPRPGVEPWTTSFAGLRPVDGIANRVRSFHARHLAAAPYVGVMIRSHTASHAKTLAASPVQWYLDRMRELRQADPDLLFFVSCDVAEVADAVIAEIGNAVALSDKGAYNTVAGVRSAVADLYLLAGSGHILGPHYSSFAEMALHLAGGRIGLETAESRNGPITTATTLSQALDPLTPSDRR